LVNYFGGTPDCLQETWEAQRLLWRSSTIFSLHHRHTRRASFQIHGCEVKISTFFGKMWRGPWAENAVMRRAPLTGFPGTFMRGISASLSMMVCGGSNSITRHAGLLAFNTQHFTVWDSNVLKLKWTSNLRLGRKKILGFRALPKTTWRIQKRKSVQLATLQNYISISLSISIYL
jgi:hypothetical protein